MKVVAVFILSIMLLLPSYALAQTSQAVVLLDNFGAHQIGERIFVFGHVSNILPDKFLILQIVNPNNDLCQIQQLTPLSSGFFITDSIALSGKLCGVTGQYTIKVYYGDYSSLSSFEILPEKYPTKTTTEYVDSAMLLVSDKIQSLREKNVDTAVVDILSSKLDSIRSNQASEGTLESLKELFVETEVVFFEEEDLFSIEFSSRQAMNSILEYSAQLLADNKITSEIDEKVKEEVYSSMFYSQIGHSQNAIDSMNEAAILLANSDPIKAPYKRALTFSELEDLVLNLMTKNTSLMSRGVQEELAFIFARGTAPLYVGELENIVDILTKARFLDNILKNQDPLYRLIKSDWEGLRSSIEQASTVEEFLERKEKIDHIHEAATLLRSLDKVERFITSDTENNSKLANILQPRWEDLKSQLELAISVDDIIESQNEITDMKNVIDISSRISKIMEFSQLNNFNLDVIDTWENLLNKVEGAQSVDEILEIVSEFDKTILDMQQNRNPLTTMEFEYKKLKSMAELQADYKNLFEINNALKIIASAQKLEKENYSGPRFDRIEVLLTWASSKLPEIKAELSSNTEESYKMRASDILQRAKSIENLVDMGITKNRFLPGYSDFAASIKEEINEARELVMKKDLDAADRAISQLFIDWQQVTRAYAEDPEGTDVGYSVDELKKIDYREKINRISNMALTFSNADFEPYLLEFFEITDNAIKSVEYGNFVDADSKIAELGSFLEDKLPLHNERIIFDISYDGERDIWTMSGAVNNPTAIREKLYLTIYDMDGNTYSNLKFSDTKSGEFFTQWQAPVELGMYVVMLQYQNLQASQIVSIEKNQVPVYNTGDLQSINIAKEFEELEEFIDVFGGENLASYESEFEPVLEKIRTALSKNDQISVKNDLTILKNLIEKHLPIKSRGAIIEATIDGDKLLVSGAVQKTLSYREELYLTVFDQQGNMVEDKIFYDDASGHYNVLLSKPNKPGLYVAQLEYHDIKVTDIFQVR